MQVEADIPNTTPIIKEKKGGVNGKFYEKG